MERLQLNKNLILGLLISIGIISLGSFWMFLYPYYKEYDTDQVEQSFTRIAAAIDETAVSELRSVAQQHKYVTASNALHYFGMAYLTFLRNPYPFYLLAENGSNSEKEFVARVVREGKFSYQEWYGFDKTVNVSNAHDVLENLYKKGVTNSAILESFRKGIERD